MELLNQIKDNFKILFLLPHGVILARKKRKKIKNVEKKPAIFMQDSGCPSSKDSI